TERLIIQGPRGSAAWAFAWRVSGAYGQTPSPEALRAYWQLVSGQPAIRAQATGAQRLRVYRATRSAIPEQRNDPPRNLRLLGELDLPGDASSP
ncbi:MAG TPA: hypothetical protein VGG33_15840, partial [Polyangia bacterium]